MAKSVRNLYRPSETKKDKNDEFSPSSDHFSDERLELAPRRITVSVANMPQPTTMEEEFEHFTALKKEIKQNKELEEELKKATSIVPKLEKKKKGTSQQAM